MSNRFRFLNSTIGRCHFARVPLTLLFGHTLEALASGTRVTHRLEIHGPDADQVGPELRPQISGDFPVAMDELLAAARDRSARTLNA